MHIHFNFNQVYASDSRAIFIQVKHKLKALFSSSCFSSPTATCCQPILPPYATSNHQGSHPSAASNIPPTTSHNPTLFTHQSHLHIQAQVSNILTLSCWFDCVLEFDSCFWLLIMMFIWNQELFWYFGCWICLKASDAWSCSCSCKCRL